VVSRKMQDQLPQKHKEVLLPIIHSAIAAIL
jgi:hypothetical protein